MKEGLPSPDVCRNRSWVCRTGLTTLGVLLNGRVRMLNAEQVQAVIYEGWSPLVIGGRGCAARFDLLPCAPVARFPVLP